MSICGQINTLLSFFVPMPGWPYNFVGVKNFYSYNTLISDAPASAAYFASYELIQRWLQGPDRYDYDFKLYLFSKT